MNSIKKQWQLVWLVCLCLISQLACANQQELTIHVSPVPPFVIDGEPRGIACDIIEQVFAMQNYKTRFIISNNKRMEAEVIKKSSDAGFGGIPLEVSGIYFSDPVVEYQNVFVSLRKNALTINQLSDLTDKKIIAFRNASRILGPEFANLIKRHNNYFEVGDQRSQIPMLDAGRGDVIVLERRAFLYFAQQLYPPSLIKERYTLHTVLAPNPRYLGFHDRALRDLFNQGLRELKRNGAYQQIFSRYIKDLDSQTGF